MPWDFLVDYSLVGGLVIFADSIPVTVLIVWSFDKNVNRNSHRAFFIVLVHLQLLLISFLDWITLDSIKIETNILKVMFKLIYYSTLQPNTVPVPEDKNASE